MRTYEGGVGWVYPIVCDNLVRKGEVVAPRGLETREFHPVSMTIVEPRSRLVTSMGRMINLPFALAEVVQILGGLNDAQMLKYYNSQIIKIQGDPVPGTEAEGGDDWELYVRGFNAAYGERLRYYATIVRDPFLGSIAGGVDQLEHIIETLKADPDSRQASAVISHPGFDNYKVQTKDRACNVYAHAMIRNGKLDWMQVMRSNDNIWGLPYNFVQWLHVMNWVASALGIEMGDYVVIQDSLHVYAKHYEECRDVEHFDIYDYIKQPLEPMLADDMWFRHNVVRWEEWIRTGGATPIVNERAEGYWYNVVQVFNSFAAFKSRRDRLAFDLLPDHPELRWPLMRNYCQWRWGLPKASVEQASLRDTCLAELIGNMIPSEKATQWLTK